MTALLIIDVQNDFLPGGSLAVKDGHSIIPLINELIPNYELVVATQDFHPPGHSSFASSHPGKTVGDVITHNGLEQILWPDHCVQGTLGTAFASALDSDNIDHIFPKGSDANIDSYSGFFDNGHTTATGLTDYLRSNQVTEVHIVGLATDYCVTFTAQDALTEGFTTRIITDACRGVNIQPTDVANALEMVQAAGAQLLTSADILGDTVTLY